MARPGFVLDVDSATPPILFWRGEHLTTEKLPVGSRALYAPEPLPALVDPSASISNALITTSHGEPLASLLNAGTKLTIAFDDNSNAVAPTNMLDSRQRVVESVLELAAAAGVDDVELIVARGLNRSMQEGELRRLLGERVFEAFAPQGSLNCHDADDDANLVAVGKTEQGEVVELNGRVATSDLVVYVGVVTSPNTGGFASLATGLTGYRTLKHCASNMESAERIGRVIAEAVDVFHIETTLDNNVFPERFAFLQRREWEWTTRDKTNYWAYNKFTNVAPPRVARRALSLLASPQAITGISAGATDAVHQATLERLRQQQSILVQGQTDIVTIGVPYFSPHTSRSVTNPVLAAAGGLGYLVPQGSERPVVRAGGVAIIHHPFRREFDPVRHPSYIDFFEQLMAETTDAHVLTERFEERFATDPWYGHLYRTSGSYHGAHPFHVWSSCAKAIEYLGGVIVVGGDAPTVHRLGFRAATTLQDALEMARDITGDRDPSLTHLHAPPSLMAGVQ